MWEDMDMKRTSGNAKDAQAKEDRDSSDIHNNCKERHRNNTTSTKKIRHQSFKRTSQEKQETKEEKRGQESNRVRKGTDSKGRRK